jgi:hypothetical protein
MLGDRKVKDRVYKRIYIQLVMTDRDIVARVADMFGTSIKDMPWRDLSTKEIWRTSAHGDRAAGWMMTIFKFMSARRQAKIIECLNAWKQSPGRTRQQRMRLVAAQEV